MLDRTVTSLGRHPDSDIFLDDVTVSRRHAEITRDDRGYEVRDAGSLNGTYVDHERVELAPAARPQRAPDRPVRADLRPRLRPRVPVRGVLVTSQQGDASAPVDRRGARRAPGRVPRRDRLEDPLPREPGPHQPRAHAVGVPEVLRVRRRPASLDPHRAARPLHAAQGDQGAARGPRPGHRRAAPAHASEPAGPPGPDRARAAGTDLRPRPHRPRPRPHRPRPPHRLRPRPEEAPVVSTRRLDRRLAGGASSRPRHDAAPRARRRARGRRRRGPRHLRPSRAGPRGRRHRGDPRRARGVRRHQAVPRRRHPGVLRPRRARVRAGRREPRQARPPAPPPEDVRALHRAGGGAVPPGARALPPPAQPRSRGPRSTTRSLELVTEARALRGALLRRAIEDALGE